MTPKCKATRNSGVNVSVFLKAFYNYASPLFKIAVLDKECHKKNKVPSNNDLKCRAVSSSGKIGLSVIALKSFLHENLHPPLYSE